MPESRRGAFYRGMKCPTRSGYIHVVRWSRSGATPPGLENRERQGWAFRYNTLVPDNCSLWHGLDAPLGSYNGTYSFNMKMTAEQGSGLEEGASQAMMHGAGTNDNRK